MLCPFCAEKIKNQAVICRFCGQKVEPQAKADTKVDISSTLKDIPNFLRNLVEKFRSAGLVTKALVVVLGGSLVVGGATLGAIKFNEMQVHNAKVAAIAKKKAEDAAALKAAIAEEARARADNSWLPTGYKKFALNPYMAYKKDGRSCASYGVCFPFTLITAKYCSSIYVAANVESGGVVYGFTNDTAKGISPNQKVKMMLQFTTDTGGSVLFTDATCY